MNKTRRRTSILPLAFYLLLILSGNVTSGQEHEQHGANGSLGTVEFRVSCTAEAQVSFTRGMALLHSFTYEESSEAFRLAAAKDPRCAIDRKSTRLNSSHGY